jgi:hypothetical protein
MKILLTLLFCVALGANIACSEESISEAERKLLQLTKEIQEKQNQITEILIAQDLKGQASLFELVLKESPKDYRETLVYLIERKRSEEELSILENKQIFDLISKIMDPSSHSKDYKLHMAEIFFIRDIEEFSGREQDLRNDMPLSGTLSEEAKSFYISYTSSLMRYLYVSRWLEKEGANQSEQDNPITRP